MISALSMRVRGVGIDLLTRALQVFCSTRPGFRVRPVAPRAQAYNKVKLVIKAGTIPRQNKQLSKWPVPLFAEASCVPFSACSMFMYFSTCHAFHDFHVFHFRLVL